MSSQSRKFAARRVIHTQAKCNIATIERGLINTSRQIGGAIGLVVLLTVANFKTPHLTAQFVIQPAGISGDGNWIRLCILGNRTGHMDRSCLYGFIHTGRDSQPGVVGATSTVSQ